MAVYHVAHHIYGARNHYELGELVDEDSKQAFCVLYNLGASNPDPLAASVVVGSTLRDGKERQFFALGAFGFRRRILKALICHGDGEACFVPHLTNSPTAQRRSQRSSFCRLLRPASTAAFVRRQSFWHQELRKLRECPAHLVGFIMRRAVCDASVALRVSFV